MPDYPFQERDIQDVAELLCTRKNFWVTDGKAVTTDADTMKVFQLALDLQADLQGHYTHFVRIEIRCTRIWLEWDTYRGMAYMPQKRK